MPDTPHSRSRLPIPGYLFVVATLMVSMPLVTTGNVFVGSLVAVRLTADGIGASTVGWVMTLHSVGFVLGTLVAGRIVRRVGHVRAFSAFAAITCIQALAYPLMVLPELWGAWRLVGGLTVAGLLTVTESWVAARSDDQNRGRLLAAYALLYYLSAMAGQLLLTVAEVSSFVPFTIAAMLIAASIVPMLLADAQAPTLLARRRMSALRLLRIAPLGVVGAFAGGVVASAFLNIGPVFGWAIGLDAAGVGWYMATGLLGAMLMQIPVGWAADRFGRPRVFGGMIAAAVIVSALAAAFAARGGVVAHVLAAAYMGVVTTLYPLSVGEANSRLEPDQLLPAAGLLLLAFGLGTIIGPIGAATTVRGVGPAGLFMFTTAALAAFAVFAVIRLRQRTASGRRGKFVPMADGSTLVMTDLRAEAAPQFESTLQPQTVDDENAHTVPDGWR